MTFPPPFPNPLLPRIPSQSLSVPFIAQKFGFFSPQRQGVMPGIPMLRPRFRPNFVPRELRPPNSNAKPTGPPTTTTVFIGNISDKCPDRIVQEVIKKCGSICNWKRLQDSSGKFKAFGFCDFMYPDGAKKALSVLKDFPLGDKRLNVKADEQTEKMLEDFMKNKMIATNEQSDDSVKALIRKFLEEEAPDLVDVPINEAGQADVRREKSPAEGSTKSSNKGSRRSRSSSAASHRHKKGSSKRSDKSPKRKKIRRHSSSSSDDSSSYSSSSRKSSNSDDSDEAEEKRRLKKEVKEREESYLARLKKWEEREKRMAKLHDKEREEEKQRLKTLQKEAKKLRQFLEDYADERDDPKYYRGSALFQRKRNYEREREADARDRQEERVELEEIRKSLMEDKSDGLGGYRGKPEDGEMEENGDASGGTNSSEDVQKVAWESVGENAEGSPPPVPPEKQTSTETESPTPVKKTIVTTLQQKPVVPLSMLNGVFQEDDEEEVDTLHQIKKKIKPFEITREDRLQSMTPEERKKMIKDLIARIPTDRAKLFAFELSWEFVDENLMEQRVRPWVNKKICEYIGEEELSLVSFICEKISNKTSADNILQDLSMVLDDEAEVFMVKLWRLIVYESEAKRLGLSGMSVNSSSNESNPTLVANR
uniref:RNA-binding protein 25 n=1 Tax=Globodera rostochiensis TaxID=31243 RepID=A0A914HJL9_GLORO